MVIQVTVGGAASADKIAQYQIDNGESAYASDTPEIRAAKEKLTRKSYSDGWFTKYQSRVENAVGNADFTLRNLPKK